MTDLLAPLRKFHRPDIPPAPEMPVGAVDQVVGQIGPFRFYVILHADGRMMSYLERQTGTLTTANIAAFWSKWGMSEPPPVDDVNEAVVGTKKAIFFIHQDEVRKMITPKVETSGPPSVLCTCDVCGRESHERAKLERSRGSRAVDMASEGQVLRRLQGKGWTYIQKTLRCPSCEDQRKSKPQPKETAPVSTEPSREQKRLIMGLLESVYSTASGRYSGGETDSTVASTLGPDFKTDWVSQIREEFFGPDGNDTALLELSAEIAELRAEIDAAAQQVTAAEASLKKLHLRLDKATEALDKIAGVKK